MGDQSNPTIQALTEERTHNDLYKKIDEVNTSVLLLTKDVKATLDTQKNFVTKDQFLPVKTIAYGFVGITLTFVLGLILNAAVSHTNAEVQAVTTKEINVVNNSQR